MSDIPRARRILTTALDLDDLADVRKYIRRALALMVRTQPEFRCAPSVPALTREQRAQARQMRRHGMPVNEIARKLGTNHGRISEAINRKPG